MGGVFDLPIDEDYYKPVITDGSFNGNYIQYGSLGGEDKNKDLSIKKYLDGIKPYLGDIINNHKAQGEQKIHLGNKRIERKTQSELKIQLTIKINCVSS